MNGHGQLILANNTRLFDGLSRLFADLEAYKAGASRIVSTDQLDRFIQVGSDLTARLRRQCACSRVSVALVALCRNTPYTISSKSHCSLRGSTSVLNARRSRLGGVDACGEAPTPRPCEQHPADAAAAADDRRTGAANATNPLPAVPAQSRRRCGRGEPTTSSSSSSSSQLCCSWWAPWLGQSGQLMSVRSERFCARARACESRRRVRACNVCMFAGARARARVCVWGRGGCRPSHALMHAAAPLAHLK
jgi:hypothetical protein